MDSKIAKQLRDKCMKAIHDREAFTNFAKQIGDKACKGCAFGDIGNCYDFLGLYDEDNQQMGPINTTHIGNKTGEGHAGSNISSCNYSTAQVDEAIQHYENILEIAKQSGDKTDERHVYSNLGNCYRSMGQYEKAIEYYEMGLNVAKLSGDKAGEGRATGNLGICYRSIGQYHKAIQHHDMHLIIAKQIGDKTDEGLAYGNLGNCYDSLGEFNKAMQCQEMYLNIATFNSDKAGEGRAYSGLGHCCRSLGHYCKAVQHHQMHLSIAQQNADKTGVGGACGNLGNCYYSLCQYDKAIQHHEKHLKIAQETGYKAGEGLALGNLGLCYFRLAQTDKALQHHERSLNIAKNIGDKESEARANGNVGLCYQYFGQYNKAIQHHEKQLNIAKQIGYKVGEGLATSNIGLCYFRLAQYDKALKHHEMSLNIAKQIGDNAGMGRAYGNLGRCYHYFGQYEMAIQHHEMSLNIVKQTGDKAGQGRAYGNLGICYYSLGQYEMAERNMMQCLPCHEELFKNTPKQDELKISIRDIYIWNYKNLIQSLLRQDKTKKALVVAEKGRSRALAELMLSSYSVNCTEVTETKVLEICEIREVAKVLGSSVLFFSLDINVLNIWVIQPNGDVKFREKDGITLSDLNWLIVTSRMLHQTRCTVECEDRSLSFLYAEKSVKETKNRLSSVLPSLMSSQDVIAPEIDRSSNLPCSSVASENQNKSLTKHSESHILTDCRNFFEEGDPGEDALEKSLNQLYQVLLDPVRELIEGTRVVVVPEGELHMVPFAALRDDKGHYVAESLQVRLLPSLATAQMLKDYPHQPENETEALIIGDPDTKLASRLPFARDEVLTIGRLLKVQPLTGKDATKDNVFETLENANLIHIAAHGDMERGEILLAPSNDNGGRNAEKEGSMLMMSDIEGKCLKAKLVVLSCCHSAHGEIKAEGVIGIARAFLGAGARAVLVALWAISDKATMYFMKSFYEHLIQGKGANESLDEAMKAMRETKEFSEPKFWAPFVLIGDDVTLF